MEQKIRYKNSVAYEELVSVLERAWSRETSFDPTGWSESNRAYGQCAVTALVVHDFFGGKFMRMFSLDEEKIEHYKNEIPDIGIKDPTGKQFRRDIVFGSHDYVTRDFILSFPIYGEDTLRRYRILRSRVDEMLEGSGNKDLLKRVSLRP